MSGRADDYRRQMTEDAILRALGGYVTTQGGVWFHVRQARGQRLVGLPDFLAVLPPRAHHAPGQFVAFEVKTQSDRLLQEQREVLYLLDRATEIVSGVVRPIPRNDRIEISLDDALALMGKQEE